MSLDTMSLDQIDARRFREALGNFASGVTVIDAIVDGIPVGFACQSFYSVSIEPPLVSFSVMKTSTSWPKIRVARGFAVNILSCKQIETCRNFGRPGVDRWANTRWSESPYGNPILDDALLTLDCSLYSEHEAGDHWLVVANVHGLINGTESPEHQPLLYYRGRYHQIATA